MRRFSALAMVSLLGLAALSLPIGNDPAVADGFLAFEDGMLTFDDHGVKHGEIAVRLKGDLAVEASGEKDQQTLSAACVRAGDMEVMLDWGVRSDIRDELLWWSVWRHADLRTVQAEVVGRMEFRPAKEVGGSRQQFAGISNETPVPVVVVESLAVQLVDSDGKPRGPQPQRPVTR